MISSAIVLSRSPSRWTALTLIVAAQFMVVLDMSIVNVALATIKNDLDFSQASLQWVITAYAIVFGGFLLLGGRLADLLGRRRIFIARHRALHPRLRAQRPGLVGRLARRLPRPPGPRRRALRAGGTLAPDDHLPGRSRAERRARHLGCGVGRGGAVGVLLGGVLTSYLSWPWIFYVNLPVGLALVALVPRYLAESRGMLAERHFDVAGAISITASLMVLVFALTRATQHGWGSASTIALLAASAALSRPHSSRSSDGPHRRSFRSRSFAERRSPPGR